MANNKKMVEQAFALYKAGEKLKDIAAALHIAEGTIRSWKNRYKWDGEKDSKNVATKKCNVAPVQRENNIDLDDGTKETFQNPDLSPKEQYFCVYYIKSFNAVQSYMKAFGAKYNVAAVEGYKTLKKPRVKEEIDRLKEIKRQQILLTEPDLVEYHMRIAFADIGDYITFGQEEKPVMGIYGPIQVKDKESGKKVTLTEKVNVVRLNESDVVDTQLIQEVKQVKGDVQIRLADKQKSLEWLDKHFMLNPMDTHKLEYDRQKYELDLLKLEMQIKDNNMDTEFGEDNFLDALNDIAGRVWSDE